MSESNVSKSYEGVSEKYQAIFRKIDEKGGGMSISFNIWAFLFSWIWYFVQGMYVKGAIVLVANILLLYFVPSISLIANLYTGLLGNYDYYVFKTNK